MPCETYVYEELYGKCSVDQLSGTNPDNGNAVQFSLIPSTATPDEFNGTVAQQRTKLAELQKETPELKVPSVLEAVTFWQTLKAAGEFDDGYDYRTTYIRHFDLPEQRISDGSCVPDSCVRAGGKPSLSDSRVRSDFSSRLSVG